MSGEFRIRAASAADLPAALELWRESQAIQGEFRPLEITGDPDDRFTERFESSLAEGRAWIVAESGGDVIAMAYLHEEKPSGMSDERVLELSRVSVLPSWRGTGVGRALVERAQQIARERGLRYLSARIFTGNKDALRFWESMDFEPFVLTTLKRLDAGGDHDQLGRKSGEEAGE